MLLPVVIIILTFIYLLIPKKRKRILEGWPQPPSNPIFGHALEINSTTEILNRLSYFMDKYGKTVQAFIGPKSAPFLVGLASADYKLIEFVLGGNQITTKSQNYGYLKPWLRNGLLLSEGDYWRKHRKILTPTFHFEILKQFVDTFESVGNVLVSKLEQYNGVDSLDLHPLVTLCTLDIISETAMGTKINAQTGENVAYVKSVKDMCRIIIDRCLSPLKLFPITFWMTKDYYVQKKALKILHDFTTKVINSKKTKRNRKEDEGKKMAFLDLLLKFSQEGAVLNDDEIGEEVDTFMFEGHDTTSSSICFTLYCLANYPEIQDKVLLEQKELFGDEKNPKITYTELQQMKYLENVIKETLRLYPAVPILGRYTTKDVEFDGRVIPEGTNIVMFVYGIHRNPEYFPEPEKFSPDRFDTGSPLPYAYIPFSAGSRNCIGQKFAMLEMKSTVSKIIRHFEILRANPSHELVLSVEVVLKSTSGIKVGLKKRS